jgi:hypothetical protein
MGLIRLAAAAVLALAALPSGAADIVGARYDANADEIVVDIVYRGTQPGHRFAVEWGPCTDSGVAARLVDRQGDDPAREEFRVRERIALGGLPCRPAEVTLRLGKVSHARVQVPALE